MTREEFESLSLNARLWAKLGENFDPPCKVEKRGGWFLNGKAYGPTGYLLVELDTYAPAFDSDDSPRWLLRDAVKASTRELGALPIARAIHPNDELWPHDVSSGDITDLLAIPADELTAAVESALLLPEWVTE